jgi:uncharacterized membrane protein YphA (DoxX/SURF4 family)
MAAYRAISSISIRWQRGTKLVAGLHPKDLSFHSFGAFAEAVNLKSCRRETLRRLYSTFARGGPGVGLLLLRLAAGITAGVRGVEGLHFASATEQSILNVVVIVDGILLAVGLWTPISGLLTGAFGAWYAVSRADHMWPGILLASVGAALALLGPGAWSIDARLFGWKRIDVRDRTKGD